MSYQLNDYKQLTHYFFAFEQMLDLLEMYPDILFINCIYKINKYNISLYIFNGIIACNKSFYISFTFLCYKGKKFYYWMLSQIHELYICIGQEEGLKVILTNKEDTVIISLKEVLLASNHMLCT